MPYLQYIRVFIYCVDQYYVKSVKTLLKTDWDFVIEGISLISVHHQGFPKPPVTPEWQVLAACLTFLSCWRARGWKGLCQKVAVTWGIKPYLVYSGRECQENVTNSSAWPQDCDKSQQLICVRLWGFSKPTVHSTKAFGLKIEFKYIK